MAQKKIRVNTALELDGTEYNITIAPVTKKTRKKIEKTFNKEKEASKEYFDIETNLANISSDLELTQELLDATEDLAEKRKLILEKKDLTEKKRNLDQQVSDGSSDVREKIADLQENMFKMMFEEMVSGEDAEKLKAYVSEYSFEMAVKQMGEVYEKELEGK